MDFERVLCDLLGLATQTVRYVMRVLTQRTEQRLDVARILCEQENKMWDRLNNSCVVQHRVMVPCLVEGYACLHTAVLHVVSSFWLALHLLDDFSNQLSCTTLVTIGGRVVSPIHHLLWPFTCAIQELRRGLKKTAKAVTVRSLWCPWAWMCTKPFSVLLQKPPTDGDSSAAWVWRVLRALPTVGGLATDARIRCHAACVDCLQRRLCAEDVAALILHQIATA